MNVARSGSDSWAKRKSLTTSSGLGGFNVPEWHPGRGGIDRRVMADPPPADSLGHGPPDDPVHPADGGRGIRTVGGADLQEVPVEAIEIGGGELAGRERADSRDDRVVDVHPAGGHGLGREARSGVVEPLVEEGADGPLLRRPWRQLVRLGDQRRQRLGCLPLVTAERALDVALATRDRVTAGVDPELPRALLPVGASSPACSLPSSLSILVLSDYRNRWTKGWTTTFGESGPRPFSASELVFLLQPQRDSNPCRHLERVVSLASRRWGRAEVSRRIPPVLGGKDSNPQ